MLKAGRTGAAGRMGRNPWHAVWAMPLLVSIIGGLLLFAVSFIPTSRIQDHAYASAYQLDEEGSEEFLSPAGRRKYSTDNYTDSLIIQTSYTLDRAHAENLLLNRIASEPLRYSQHAYLVDTVEGNVTATESYSRYWMGFRVLIRPLLAVTAYRGIRMLVAALDWLLLALAVATTAKRGSLWTALALAAAVGLTQPYAIVSSLQFSTCYLLALALIAWLNCAHVRLGERRCFAAFCLFGALTQFFDFYTTPILVFALPLLVLAARQERGEKLWRPAGALFGGWLASWLLTWLFKLCLVTLLTDENGFANAFASVAMRFGLAGHRIEEPSYSPLDAFARVWDYIGLPPARLVLPLLLFGIALLLLAAYRRDRKNGRPLFFLAAACLPLLWMAATPQPIYIHYWFQYRSLCALYFALLLCAGESVGPNGSKTGLTAKMWRE